MKNISVTLEDLSNGNVRATCRHNNSTVCWMDSKKEDAIILLNIVMNKGCFAHKIGNKFDLTYIELNDYAKNTLESSNK
jgi:hypothetical protein